MVMKVHLKRDSLFLPFSHKEQTRGQQSVRQAGRQSNPGQAPAGRDIRLVNCHLESE